MCQLLQTAVWTVDRVQMARSSMPKVSRCSFIHFSFRHLNLWYNQSIMVKQNFHCEKKKSICLVPFQEHAKSWWKLLSASSHVRPSVRMYQLCSHWDFTEVSHENTMRLKSGNNVGHFLWRRQYVLLFPAKIIAIKRSFRRNVIRLLG
jgi:hypothetical protein